MQAQLNNIDASSNLPLTRGGSPSPLVEMARDFSQLSRPTAREISKFREMFYVLVLRTSYQERLEISRLLSTTPFTPRTIAIYFGVEDIEIAKPMLLSSPVLGPHDLNNIIGRNAIEHCLIIARRKTLELETISLLLDKDNADKEIEALVFQSCSAARKLEVLQYRDQKKLQKFAETQKPDVEIKKLEPSTDQITGHGNLIKKISPEKVPSAEVPKDISHKLLKLARFTKPGEMSELSSERRGKTELCSYDALFSSQLIEYARIRDFETLSDLMASKIGMTAQSVLDVLQSDNGGLQASLFCALALRKTLAARLLLLLNQEVGRDAEVFKLVMQKYDQLDQVTCHEYFTGSKSEHKQRPQHVGHFSAAIAERRRDIESTKPSGLKPSGFGELLHA